jgi:carboxylesterase type B
MTTFNTKNQAKRKYFYTAAILVIFLVVVSLTFNSFRNSSKCDPNTQIKNLSLSESVSKVKEEIKEFVTISTNFGQIKGVKNKFNNITINTFLGVPYASAPIGSLRFEKTSPIQKWEGIRDALQQPASCLQTDSPLVLSAFRFLNSSSSEDCLYLNIWAPEQEDQFLPVIVYIHGGAFAYGGVATEELDGIVLAAKQKVVLVTIQYRLGIFGFISFQTQEPFGNMGLYDQREALKWIHSNINKFGGDHDSITVVGHGAGAVSAGIHMMTPQSKSYFQRSILQGLSLLWPKQLYSQSIKYSKKFVEQINCMKAPKIKECIKLVNVDKLLETQTEILEDNPVAFAPVISNDFLKTFPSESKELFDFQTDFMLGINSEDDTLFLTTLRNSEEERDQEKDSEENDSKEDDNSKEESTTSTTPIDRITSKPMLIITTLPNTTFKSNDSVINEDKNQSNNNSETMSTNEPNVDEKDDEEVEENVTPATDNSDTDSEEENDDEEDGRRRRRRKRLAPDEYSSKIVCPLLEFADAIVETNRSVYIYQLNEFSSYHDEIVFAFGYPLKYKNLYDSEEIKFSNYVMNNWVQFAKNGDLSETNKKWMSYSKEKPSYLKMSISNTILDKFDLKECHQMNAE